MVSLRSVSRIQSITGATPPVETAAEQDTRSSEILSRADSVLLSGGYGRAFGWRKNRSRSVSMLRRNLLYQGRFLRNQGNFQPVRLDV